MVAVAIAVHTTTISIKRSPTGSVSERDPWERTSNVAALPAPATIASGVRADISIGRGSGRSGGPGDTETIEFSLVCDPTDLSYSDLVVDERTGTTYAVAWAMDYPGFPGLEHVTAGLRTVTGFGND